MRGNKTFSGDGCSVSLTHSTLTGARVLTAQLPHELHVVFICLPGMLRVLRCFYKSQAFQGEVVHSRVSPVKVPFSAGGGGGFRTDMWTGADVVAAWRGDHLWASAFQHHRISSSACADAGLQASARNFIAFAKLQFWLCCWALRQLLHGLMVTIPRLSK